MDDDHLKTKEELVTELQELRERVAKLEMALDSLEEAVTICDITGEVTYMNRSCEDLMGQKGESIVGNDFFRTLAIPDIGAKIKDESEGIRIWKGSFTMENNLYLDGKMEVSLLSHKQTSPYGEKFIINVMTAAGIMVCRHQFSSLKYTGSENRSLCQRY